MLGVREDFRYNPVDWNRDSVRVEEVAGMGVEHGDALPGLAFFVAGADPHEHDRLGRLKLSFEGLAERDRRVFEALRRRGIPVAVSMAGGYGQQVHGTVAVHLRTLIEALHSWQVRAAAMDNRASDCPLP